MLSKGGNIPLNNSHSVIERPEFVSLVKPPTIIIKNTNIKFLNKSSIQLIIIIEDRLIQNIFKNYFKTSLIKTTNLKLEFIDRLNSDTSMIMATTLSNYGWKKEAIPMTQTKNSIISKIFKYLFN